MPRSLLAALALAAATPAVLRAADAPTSSLEMDLVLIFDNSSSMYGSVKGGRKWDIAREAAKRFIDTLPPSMSVGLVAFGGSHCGAVTVATLKPATAQYRGQIARAIGDLGTQDTTPLAASLREAARLLAGSRRRKRIVVLTDGEESCDHAGLAAAADEAWKQGAKVYAVGFALGGAPSANFRRMGLYMDAGDDKQLASVLKDIRKSLEREGSGYDESARHPALAETPPFSFKGRTGHFRSGAGARAAKLFKTLQFDAAYDHPFGAQDRFTVLEHGYHVRLDEEKFVVEKLEALRVRLEERPGFLYGGTEGFVFAEDVAVP